jgi:hypothetical protein
MLAEFHRFWQQVQIFHNHGHKVFELLATMYSAEGFLQLQVLKYQQFNHYSLHVQKAMFITNSKI